MFKRLLTICSCKPLFRVRLQKELNRLTKISHTDERGTLERSFKI